MANTRTTRPRTGTTRARQTRPKGETLTFKGETYRLADKIGVWPLLQLARAAESGVSIRDQRGLAATHAMLEDAIHPDDWGKFQDDMIANKVDDLEDLLATVTQATQVIIERQAKKANANGKAVVQGEVAEE